MAPLNRDNVQSLVLAPYQRPISRHLLFKLGSKEGGRRLIAALLPSIASGERDPTAQDVLVNMALSWEGLKAIGAFDAMGGDVVAARAFYIFNDAPDPASLRVAGVSAPDHWWDGRFTSADIQVVVHLHVSNEADLQKETALVRGIALACDAVELLPDAAGEAITGRQIDGRRLHFGYMDGISHPAVNWDDDPAKADQLPRGDFLLGYPGGNYSTYPDEPPFVDLFRDGSLVAFMQMYQDVAAFNRFLRESGPIVSPNRSQSDAEEYLAAKVMGRWRDGTPLALSPERPNPAMCMADDFGYADDPNGLKCPMAAHIRIANARDQPLNPMNAQLFPGGYPRVLRRGSPYGPPLEGDDDDGANRGIVGLFLCANLNKQFYSLTRWLGRTDFGPASMDPVGQDPIVGNRAFPGASDTFTVAGDGTPVVLTGMGDFVKLRGVAFLLLPSVSALRAIAR